MRKLITRFAVPLVIFVAAACASSQSTGGSRTTTYRKQVGQATRGDLARKTRMIFDRFHFVMERQDSSISRQMFQSRWEGRFPLRDEIDSGVVEARTRLTVRARARGAGGSGASDTRIVEILVENMVRMAEDAPWRRGFMTPMFLAYADRINEDLKMELIQGVRVF